MMSLTRRQIATILSVIWLTALTILAGYASHSSNTYSLPIPNTLNALTLALPPIAGITIETSNAIAASLSKTPKFKAPARRRSTIPPVLLPSTLTIVALLVYATVIATLAGTRIAPLGGLTCSLQERWTELFRSKDGDDVRKIQDAFECCGFRSTNDMAFPFPGDGRGAGACVKAYGRDKACFEDWRGEERLVAGLMVAVAVGVFLWMIVVVATPAIHTAAIRDSLRLPYGNRDEEQDQSQRVIDYPRYTDEAEAETQPHDDEIGEEVTRLNSQSEFASMVEGSRSNTSGMMHSGLVNNADKWAARSDD